MRMSVVPEQARRMIARNLNRVVKDLPRLGEHGKHVILRGIRRNGKPVKMQVRHVHAGIYCTTLRGLGGKLVDVRDFENDARGSTDHGSHIPAVESESIPAIFIHCMQREGYNAILRSNLRRLRQGNSLTPAQTRETYLRTDEDSNVRAFCGPLSRHSQFRPSGHPSSSIARTVHA